MKYKKILCILAAIAMLMCTTTAYADTNWNSGDSSSLTQALNGDNIWLVYDKDNNKVGEAEGLRVTVYDAESDTKVFKTIDITGDERIQNVSNLFFFGTGSDFIPKTTWISSGYVGGTYNALDEGSKTRYHNTVESKIKRYGYQCRYVPALSNITIISENNTSNLEAIRKMIGNKDFLIDLCTLIDGLEYENITKGKYKISFEPIAYMTIAGTPWVLSATECAILDKYMLDVLGTTTGAIKSKMGPLTHSQMPLSAFLEKEELKIEKFAPQGKDILHAANGEIRYQNGCIIRSMGIGVLNSLEKDEETKNPGASITTITAEYHTDTDVYTSFYFKNDSEADLFGGGKFSIYDSNGETPKSSDGPISEQVVVGYDDDDDEEYAYLTDEVGARHISEESSVAVFVENPEYMEKPYGVAPYKRLGSFKDGDFIKGDSDDFSYTIRSSRGTTIASGTISFSCPSGEEAMGWFDWHTPKSAQDITITISSNREDVYILDSNGDPSSSVKINAKVDKVKERTPPDPTATDKRPSWQKVYSDSDVLSGAAQYAPVNGEQELTWYVWTYDWYQEGWSKSDKEIHFTYVDEEDRDSDDFTDAALRKGSYYPYIYGVDNRYYRDQQAIDKDKMSGSKIEKAVILSGSARKTEYTVRISADMEIKPSEHCYTSTYSNSSGKYTMKSGYGIQIAVNAHLSGDTDLCTGSQKANVLFPEFNYSSEPSAQYNRLLEKNGRTYVFKENEYSTYKDRVHFTPIWYPDDSDYTVYAEVFDVWCPAGQLSVRLTDQMIIKGNVFDDWHVAPDKP